VGVGGALAFMSAHLAEADMVGEAGLDFKYAATEEAREAQRAVLREQLAMAAGTGLGVNLHSRRAQREVLEAAQRFRTDAGLPALLHWFTHSSKLIARAAGAGVSVSAGPAVLYSDETLRVACSIPLQRLVLESDAPVPFSGVPAEPGQVPAVAEALARGHGLSVEALAGKIYANACGLLPRER
jgi:TatD DNase family protein